MAIKIKIDGIGTVEVDDSFADLSPEEQNRTIDEIVASTQRPTTKGPKKYDWISDVTGTIGSVAGGLAGAGVGTLLGPAGTVGGAVGGSAAGGAAFGALGEQIEGWLDPRGREAHDVASTAITEGAWGLIPGLGGALTKGGIRGAGRAIAAPFRALFGKAVPAPSETVLKGLAKLSKSQKKFVAENVGEEVLKDLRKKAAGDFASDKAIKKADDLMEQWVEVMINGGPDAINRLFKQSRGNPVFEAYIDRYYGTLINRGLLTGAAAEAVIRSYGPDLEGYAEGGLIEGSHAKDFLNKYILGEKTQITSDWTNKDAAALVADLTPVVGDVKAAYEVAEEMKKDNPNWLLVGALGGAALVGLIPGLGDAAAAGIKRGARAALEGGEAAVDLVKRIEVDPNTLGTAGGNIRIKPKASDSPAMSTMKHKEAIEAERAAEWLEEPKGQVVTGFPGQRAPADQIDYARPKSSATGTDAAATYTRSGVPEGHRGPHAGLIDIPEPKRQAAYGPDSPKIASDASVVGIEGRTKRTLGGRSPVGSAGLLDTPGGTGATGRAADTSRSLPREQTTLLKETRDAPDFVQRQRTGLKDKDADYGKGSDEKSRKLLNRISKQLEGSRAAEMVPAIHKFANNVPEQFREDAIQDALVAVLEAEKRFDPTKSNAAFSTFAWNSVRNAVRNTSGVANEAKRQAYLNALDKTKSFDAPVGSQGGERIYPKDQSEIVQATGDTAHSSPIGIDVFTSEQIRQTMKRELSEKDYKLFEGLRDQAASQLGPERRRTLFDIEPGGTQERLKRISDGELMEELNLSRREFQAGKKRILKKMDDLGLKAGREKGDASLFDVDTSRTPGPEEKFGPASPVRSLLK